MEWTFLFTVIFCFLFKMWRTTRSLSIIRELISSIDSQAPPRLREPESAHSRDLLVICTQMKVWRVSTLEGFQGNFLKPQHPLGPKPTWPPDLSLFLQLIITGQYCCQSLHSLSVKMHCLPKNCPRYPKIENNFLRVMVVSLMLSTCLLTIVSTKEK